MDQYAVVGNACLFRKSIIFMPLICISFSLAIYKGIFCMLSYVCTNGKTCIENFPHKMNTKHLYPKRSASGIPTGYIGLQEDCDHFL